MARLFYGTRRDGKPAKARVTTPSKTSTRRYLLEPGYDSAKYILDSMVKGKVRERGKDKPLLERYESDNKARVNLYHRPGARISTDEKLTYGHDMAVVVSYVLLECSGRLEGFQRFWDDEQRKEFGVKWDLWPDAVFVLTDKPDHTFFLEIDGGTEWEKGQLLERLEAYVRFANAHPNQRLTVLLPTKGYKRQTDEQRVENVLDALATLRRQNMFLVTTWSKWVGDLKLMDGNPLGHIFQSPWQKPGNPLDPSAISILDVA